MKKEIILTVFVSLSLLPMAFGAQFATVPVQVDLKTIYVDASNIDDPEENGSIEHPFDKIQEGIDVAISGDTVLVGAGTYYEQVTVNKSLSLVGENKNVTVIDGNGSSEVVTVWADNVVITGFTIRNGGWNVFAQNFDKVSVCDNLLTYLRDGWQIVHKLENGNLIIRRGR